MEENRLENRLKEIRRVDWSKRKIIHINKTTMDNLKAGRRAYIQHDWNMYELVPPGARAKKGEVKTFDIIVDGKKKKVDRATYKEIQKLLGVDAIHKVAKKIFENSGFIKDGIIQ